MKKTKTNSAAAAPAAGELVFVSTRIPADLNDALNIACDRKGLKKQAVIATGIKNFIAALKRRQRRK